MIAVLLKILILQSLLHLPGFALQQSKFCQPDDTDDESSRLDCGYYGIEGSECLSRNCCWSPSGREQEPWCFFSQNSCKGYRVARAYHWYEQQLQYQTYGLKLIGGGECELYGKDVEHLLLEIWLETDQQFHFKISQSNASFFENYQEAVSAQKIESSQVNEAVNDKQLDFQLNQDPFSLIIMRRLDGQVLFDLQTLIYENGYLEIATTVPLNANIYGLGEQQHAYRLDPNHTRIAMWARDAATPSDQNLYGAHPFYMEMRDGNAHGVFLNNQHGMDVFLTPGRVTYKVLGGSLDFYVFAGSEPAQVVQQYLGVIGRPYMIAYWMLGFHQCRWGYETIGDVEAVVDQYRNAGIPLETMWTDIDYMDEFKDFTLDSIRYPIDKVQAFVEKLHGNDQHYVMILDPAIKIDNNYAPYVDLISQNLMIMDSNGKPVVGKVWPGLTVFPDFLNPATQQWWTKQIHQFMNVVDLDGLWIDMNEPSSFCLRNHGQQCAEERNTELLADNQQVVFHGSKYTKNYKYNIANGGGIELPLLQQTLPPDAVHYRDIKHINVHNIYGHSEAVMTRRALDYIKPGKRTLILSRSTSPGTGQYAGHWTGDNHSQWDHLYFSISSMLNFQLFGIPFVGADICGFVGNSNEELCARWIQVGAFYPFSRNHNGLGNDPQELYVWEAVAAISRKVLAIRHQLLPYYYTLFYFAHSYGHTVVRPLLSEFPRDSETMQLDRQFMIGSAIMVSPVVLEHATTVDAYFPAGNWFDWYSHQLVSESDAGRWLTLDAPLDVINLHVRGGKIITLQEPAMTTAASRKTPFTILVALDSKNLAAGHFYMDDGESLPLSTDTSSLIEFMASVEDHVYKVSSTGRFNYTKAPHISTIKVLGLQSSPNNVEVAGVDHDDYTFHNGNLIINNLNLPMEKFIVQWN